MPDNDLNELQELLSKCDPTRDTDHSGDPDDIVKGKSETEYTQWVILPNKAYMAAGATSKELPVGAYIVHQTDRGDVVFSEKKILTDALIDLGESNSIRIINGIKLFWTRKKEYQKRNILYKRGVLMWGPPGSGKTATLALLIKNLIEQGGIVLLIQNPNLAIAALQQLRKIEPERPLIIVLEDIEEIIRAYGEHGLLALLDGEHQTDNVVNVATTNYPEELGARIVNRPSRFDEVFKIGMPSPMMRLQYFQHILGEEVKDYPLEIWVNDTEGMSIAHLKELAVAITCLDQPYDQVIARLSKMKIAPKSSSANEPAGFVVDPSKSYAINGLLMPTGIRFVK